MISRRILPWRTSVSLAAMISRCQFGANGACGLSSEKQRSAKKPKSDRRIALYSEGERALIAGSPILVSEARLDALNNFVVGLGEDRRISRAVILRFKLAQHRKHDLGGLKISRGRFVHQLRDDRLALGDPFAPPIRNDDDGRV